MKKNTLHDKKVKKVFTEEQVVLLVKQYASARKEFRFAIMKLETQVESLDRRLKELEKPSMFSKIFG